MGDVGINENTDRRKVVSRAWRLRGKRSLGYESNMADTRDKKVLDNEEQELSSINSEYHIIYRRKDSHIDPTSDYRKFKCKCLHL